MAIPFIFNPQAGRQRAAGRLQRLAARLPGFAFQQLTNSTPDAAPLMYMWPALWIVVLLVLLSLPSLELLKRGGTPAAPSA